MNNEIKEKVYHLSPEVKVYYGINICNHFFEVLNQYDFNKVFFVTEKNLYELHGKKLVENLVNNGVSCEVLMINAIEEEKNMDTLYNLCCRLIDMKISKDSIVVGFGGGIVGNVTGLAAAMIYRGVKYVEIPTTFMGQTDSSLSNKQAVNGRSGKNQLGVYSAPIFIWSDILYLETESIRHIKAGIVEGIKNGLISNYKFLDVLLPKVLGKESFSVEEIYDLFDIITDSKNVILAQDPSEKKYGVVLEYGHTFGHAIEFLSNGEVIHGEAVAMGMCIAAEISYVLGYLTKEDVDKHYEILDEFMYNKDSVTAKKILDAEKIFTEIQNDNKRTKYGIKYVLLSALGECNIGDGDYQVMVKEEVVLNAIKSLYQRKYANIESHENMSLLYK